VVPISATVRAIIDDQNVYRRIRRYHDLCKILRDIQHVGDVDSKDGTSTPAPRRRGVPRARALTSAESSHARPSAAWSHDNSGAGKTGRFVGSRPGGGAVPARTSGSENGEPHQDGFRRGVRRESRL